MKKHILLVDDDRSFVKMLVSILGNEYDVSVAYNGEEAMNQIKIIKPDLILLDIVMNKMDGFEFFDRITPLHRPPLYPVLIMTARDNLRELFVNLPLEGFITKPFEMETLLAKIREIFNKQENRHLSAHRQGPQKILIVDNNPERVGKIAAWFLDREITVATAKTGEGAIARIIGTDFPDLILICVGLPGRPEHTISYHLKGMPEARHIVVAVYTDDYSAIDVQMESEISKTVGEKNFLELRSIDHFFSRCEQMLKLNQP